ncbi:MAG TPA: carbohydrate kinase family protein [Gaiellaceae bacterium]|nr:carbohydrate kinase family protein [Gaiellaceae bacterium]
MRPLGVIGHLSSDRVAEAEPRIGGGPWHAARALRALSQSAVVAVKCGEAERSAFLRRLATLGLPVSLATGGETTAFSFSYDADAHRTMSVDAIGEPWTPDELPAALLRRVEWLHVAPLLRDDLPAETLERLARGRRVLFDGQGLGRARRTGPLELDADFDPALLRHVSILKLAEEEARAIVGDGDLEELRGLGVPEVVVTFGLAGSLVLARGVAERVQAWPVDADPTGAGDAFSVAYLGARAAGHAPVSAARRATALVASLLAEGVR